MKRENGTNRVRLLTINRYDDHAVSASLMYLVPESAAHVPARRVVHAIRFRRDDRQTVMLEPVGDRWELQLAKELDRSASRIRPLLSLWSQLQAGFKFPKVSGVMTSLDKGSFTTSFQGAYTVS